MSDDFKILPFPEGVDPDNEEQPLVSREKCILVTGDSLARAVRSLELWAERAKNPVERRTVERLRSMVFDVMQHIHIYTKTL